MKSKNNSSLSFREKRLIMKNVYAKKADAIDSILECRFGKIDCILEPVLRNQDSLSDSIYIDFLFWNPSDYNGKGLNIDFDGVLTRNVMYTSTGGVLLGFDKIKNDILNVVSWEDNEILYEGDYRQMPCLMDYISADSLNALSAPSH